MASMGLKPAATSMPWPAGRSNKQALPASLAGAHLTPATIIIAQACREAALKRAKIAKNNSFSHRLKPGARKSRLKSG
jgi:hypothetical protein